VRVDDESKSEAKQTPVVELKLVDVKTVEEVAKEEEEAEAKARETVVKRKELVATAEEKKIANTTDMIDRLKKMNEMLK
jgi:hypothetical protein